MKLDQLARKIKSFSYVPESEIQLDTDITDVLDSLAFVELVMDLESDYDIELSDYDLENVKTVSELLELINNNI